MKNIFRLMKNTDTKFSYDIFCRRNNFFWRMWKIGEKLRDLKRVDLGEIESDDFLFVRSLLSSSHMFNGIIFNGIMRYSSSGTKKYQIDEHLKNSNEQSVKNHNEEPVKNQNNQADRNQHPRNDEIFNKINQTIKNKDNDFNKMNSTDRSMFSKNNDNQKYSPMDSNFLKNDEKENFKNRNDYSKYSYLDFGVHESHNELDNFNESKFGFDEFDPEMNQNLRLTTPDYQNLNRMAEMASKNVSFYNENTSRPLSNDIKTNFFFNDLSYPDLNYPDLSYLDQNNHFLNQNNQFMNQNNQFMNQNNQFMNQNNHLNPQNSDFQQQNPYFPYDEYAFYYDNPYVNSAPCIPNSNNLFGNIHKLGQYEEIDHKKNLLPSRMEQETRKLKVGTRKKREIKNIAQTKDKDYVCYVCGIKDTPVWRRINKQKVCNACGLYFKNKRLREKKGEAGEENIPKLFDKVDEKNKTRSKRGRKKKNPDPK
ncbi:hypothetical protein DMUE_0401 [Dictyocoela muelleri]|nr:hypothetical protein DMUE_0401 [Dictyocoela muelleri]